MNLFYTIKQTLESISQDELLKSMGYINIQRGQKTLNHFLEIQDTYIWLKNGGFDLKYNSKEFLYHLLKALDLPLSLAEEEIQRSQKRLDSLSKMQQPYIFIDTNFQRKEEPVFVLAMIEGRRHISVDKESLLYKSENEIIGTIGDIVKKHYHSNEGKLQLWGEIYTYIYHSPEGKRFIFNPNGTLYEEFHDISESKAEIRLNSQIITCLQV